MANKTLFRSIRGRLLPKADAVNEAGGTAYRLEARHALAQYAATGCLNGTFYASAEMQLAEVLGLCERVEPEFIARTALYARREGHMKDMPALLCAVLSVRGPGLMAEVFDRVIDTPKMLRNYVQIMRSGVVGRRSFGTLPKRLVRQWLEARSDERLFLGSIGRDPSLADIIRMVHPRPATKQREALLGYLLGRSVDVDALPPLVRQYEAYKAAADRRELETPHVPFRMLAGLSPEPWEWKVIARRAPWQTTRMNLGTFARHGVFEDPAMVRLVAERLRDREQIARARVFPYQLMVAYCCAPAGLPGAIREALQDAMEIATENVPRVSGVAGDGKVYVLPDISGSMHSPVTGHRRGATTAVRCVDVAALVAATVLRANPEAEVIPFHSHAIPPEQLGLNPRDSVMTNAYRLASLPSGGTSCSAPMSLLNHRKATGDLVIYVSDNESWRDTTPGAVPGTGPTKTMRQWAEFRHRNPGARLMCIDIQPYGTVQAPERPDITHVGGFSDQVFELMATVAVGGNDAEHWVKRIEAQRL